MSGQKFQASHRTLKYILPLLLLLSGAVRGASIQSGELSVEYTSPNGRGSASLACRSRGSAIQLLRRGGRRVITRLPAQSPMCRRMRNRSSSPIMRRKGSISARPKRFVWSIRITLRSRWKENSIAICRRRWNGRWDISTRFRSTAEDTLATAPNLRRLSRSPRIQATARSSKTPAKLRSPAHWERFSSP